MSGNGKQIQANQAKSGIGATHQQENDQG